MSIVTHLIYFLIIFTWRNELVAFTMNIDNLNLRIVFQMLAQLGDIHIH